jgi:hypothetical protein
MSIVVLRQINTRTFTYCIAVFIVFRGVQSLAPNKFILVIKDPNSIDFICLKLVFDKSECGTGWAVAPRSWVYGCDSF